MQGRGGGRPAARRTSRVTGPFEGPGPRDDQGTGAPAYSGLPGYHPPLRSIRFQLSYQRDSSDVNALRILNRVHRSAQTGRPGRKEIRRMKPTTQQFEVMSPRKFNTGVLFRGPRHAFIRNPPARSHARSSITRTTRSVDRKSSHDKSAHGTIQQLGYQPVNDHSAKLISSQSKANEYPSA